MPDEDAKRNMNPVERETRCFGDFYVRSKPIAQSLHDLADVGGFLPGAYQGALSAASYRSAKRMAALASAKVELRSVRWRAQRTDGR